MSDERTSLIYDAVERQSKRSTYPEGFPPLPEVPVSRYADPEFHDIEMRHLWRKSWLHAGHISEIAEPGSYKLFEQLGLSIILSRGADGEIRAFHNICRHRGSALLLEKTGVARRFICPYHSWGYAADGSLTSVPNSHDFACLDKANRGLMPVRCEIMRGMIYVNFDSDAQPLADYFATTERQIGEFPLEDMVVKGTLEIELECNWKTAYDNFLEIYHVSTVHRDSIAPYLASDTFTLSLFRNGHGRFVTRKRGGATIFQAEATPEAPATLYKDHTIALPMFPNSFVALDPVGFAWQSWWPVGPKKSVMVMTMMGWKDDSETDRRFWEGMRTQIHDIAAEDMRLFAKLQRSLDSGLTPGILLSYQERAIYWYQEEIDRRIGIENIPERFRMTPVLARYVED